MYANLYRMFFAAAGIAISFAAVAQKSADYPGRPVKLVAAAAAGGSGTDLIARVLAEKLQALWGQGVVVDNKPGANGVVAVRAVLQAPADGYTFLVIHTAFVQNLALRPHVYNPLDFTGISQVASSSASFAVSSASHVNTLAEFLAWERSRPGQMSYGSFGLGSTAHFFGEMLNAASGAKLVHVPFNGSPASLTALLGGEISSSWADYSLLDPFVKAGKVKVLAVSGSKRIPLAPDVPTFVELGFPQLGVNGWFGVIARAGTPPDLVKRVAEDIGKVVALPDVRAKLIRGGLDPIGSNAFDFDNAIASDIQRWKQMVKAHKIVVE